MKISIEVILSLLISILVGLFSFYQDTPQKYFEVWKTVDAVLPPAEQIKICEKDVRESMQIKNVSGSQLEKVTQQIIMEAYLWSCSYPVTLSLVFTGIKHRDITLTEFIEEL